MIEWTFFYRMLGIPERVTEPTVYELLGLTDPRTATPELVEHALNERKKRLRHNIPTPQFIPIVLLFEQELDRAAAILLDPQKRSVYHERLAREARARRRTVKARAARQRLVRAARQVIRDALNQDGTLEDNRRAGLARRLRGLGVPERDIQEVLARIPAPAPEPAQPSAEATAFFVNAADLAMRQGLLTETDEHKLSQLAAKLGIPGDVATATIDQRLAARGARRGKGDAAVVKAWFAEQVRSRCPDRRPTEQEHAYLLALASSEGMPAKLAEAVLTEHVDRLPPQPGRDKDALDAAEADDIKSIQEIVEILDEATVKKRSGVLRAIRAVGVPVTAIVVFSLFLAAYDKGLLPRRFPAAARSPGSASPSPDSSGFPGPAGTDRPDPAPPDVDPVEPGEAIVTAPEEPTESFPPAHEPGETGPRTPAPPIRPLVEEVRRIYSPETGSPEALLTDVTLTMLAGCGQASQFTRGFDLWSGELRAVLASANAAQALTRSVTVTTTPDPAPPANDPDRLETVQNQLRSRSMGTRYRAIEELRGLNRPAATVILLDALEARVAKDPRTSARILRALRDMSDPRIPRRLIATIPAAPARSAHLIVQALMDETSLYVAPGSEGRLPLKNTSRQRQACRRWWEHRHNQGRLSWGAGRSYRPPPGPVSRETDAWRPDPLLAKLIAVSTLYAQLTAEALEGYRWEAASSENIRIELASEVVVSEFDLAADLLEALDAVVDQLGRLVREHPDGKKYAIKADLVEREKKARVAASETLLQKAAVSLDAIGAMLNLLVRELDRRGTRTSELDRIRRERQEALAETSNVIHEMRTCAEHNLVLWDLLCRVN